MAIKKDPFENWREDQEVYEDVSIEIMRECLEKRNINRAIRKISYLVGDLQSYAGVFNRSSLSDALAEYTPPTSKEIKKACEHIYALLDHDIEKFVSYLQANQFSTEQLNKIEKKQGVNKVVKKYADIFKILFDQGDDDETDQFLFAIANRFFEFCFRTKKFAKFKRLLKDEKQHSVLRLIYSIMWANLAEIGWQHWHADCIKALKKDAKAGKEIVYIAGGTDIYQLIKNGIYNIRVIDPMLPSQPKYYSEEWEWFIKTKDKSHGVGEEVMFSCGKKTLIMKRASYKPTGKSITMELSTDETVKIKESVTTWHLYDKAKKKLGSIVFERRLTNQKDFVMSKKRTLFVSFNELYFIAAPKERDGWGIIPSKFDDKFLIHVKQLRGVVDKEIVCNLRYEVKQLGFAFIELGSCVD